MKPLSQIGLVRVPTSPNSRGFNSDGLPPKRPGLNRQYRKAAEARSNRTGRITYWLHATKGYRPI